MLVLLYVGPNEHGVLAATAAITFFAMPLTPLLLAVCDGWLVGCLPVCLPICLGCSGGALLITSSSIVLLAKRTNAQPYVFHSFFYIHFEVLFFTFW